MLNENLPDKVQNISKEQMTALHRNEIDALTNKLHAAMTEMAQSDA